MGSISEGEGKGIKLAGTHEGKKGGGETKPPRTHEKRKEGGKHYIQRQRTTTIRRLIAINPHERLTPLKQPGLQTDHDKLHARPRVVTDVSRDLGDVGVVEGGVDFVKDEEGGGLVAVHGEEEGQRRHGFFAAGEVLHVAEAFERRHGVVFDSVEVGLVGVFDVEVAFLGGGEG